MQTATIPTLAEASAAIARKQLSPVELTRACLERIARDDAHLHCFITLTADRALAEARAAEPEIVRSGPRGPLHGIPIAHKDIFETAGLRTTAHSRVLEDYVPAADGTVVRMFADAGTVMLGKLATYEFALGGPSFDLPWPPTRNPWDRERTAGGSSSGSGAGVAAGFFLAATGSDTGGSIRTPAAYCGTAGIKPTYGRVSRHGVLPLAYSLDHVGLLAWTSQDCALALQAIAGWDPSDPGSVHRPVPDFCGELGRGLRGVRIGVARHLHERDAAVSAPTRAALDVALAALAAGGAEIMELALPPLVEWSACALVINLSEAFDVHAERLRTQLDRYGERLRSRLVLGATVAAADYVQALRRRRELRDALGTAMAGVDALITASVVDEAPRLDADPGPVVSTKANLAHVANLSGYPALSVCTGFAESGLPLSMQLIGKPFAEPTLFRIGHAYEQQTPWRSRRPE